MTVANWLCLNLVFGTAGLDGVGHLGGVGGQRNRLQVVTVTLDMIDLGSGPKPLKRLRFDVDGQDEGDGRLVINTVFYLSWRASPLSDLSHIYTYISIRLTFYVFISSKSGGDSTLIQKLAEMSK